MALNTSQVRLLRSDGKKDYNETSDTQEGRSYVPMSCRLTRPWPGKAQLQALVPASASRHATKLRLADSLGIVQPNLDPPREMCEASHGAIYGPGLQLGLDLRSGLFHKDETLAPCFPRLIPVLCIDDSSWSNWEKGPRRTRIIHSW
jgi:hypothetical protein